MAAGISIGESDFKNYTRDLRGLPEMASGVYYAQAGRGTACNCPLV